MTPDFSMVDQILIKKKQDGAERQLCRCLIPKLEIAMDLPAHWQHLQKNWDIKR